MKQATWTKYQRRSAGLPPRNPIERACDEALLEDLLFADWLAGVELEVSAQQVGEALERCRAVMDRLLCRSSPVGIGRRRVLKLGKLAVAGLMLLAPLVAAADRMPELPRPPACDTDGGARVFTARYGLGTNPEACAPEATCVRWWVAIYDCAADEIVDDEATPELLDELNTPDDGVVPSVKVEIMAVEV